MLISFNTSKGLVLMILLPLFQLNEFRKFMGLRRECLVVDMICHGCIFTTAFPLAYTTFSEWNPNPIIHVCLALYTASFLFLTSCFITCRRQPKRCMNISTIWNYTLDFKLRRQNLQCQEQAFVLDILSHGRFWQMPLR